MFRETIKQYQSRGCLHSRVGMDNIQSTISSPNFCFEPHFVYHFVNKNSRPPNDVLILACWPCHFHMCKNCFACNCSLFQIVILLSRRRRTFWRRNTCSALPLLVWLSCASPPLAAWREGWRNRNKHNYLLTAWRKLICLVWGSKINFVARNATI